MSPMFVIEATFSANAGDLESSDTRSATNASARLRSSTALPSSIGTAPAAASGATTTTGAGGASTSAPAAGAAAGVVGVDDDALRSSSDTGSSWSDRPG